MIYLHKILPFFVSPLFFVLLALVIGVALRRRVWVVVGITLLLVFSSPFVAESLSESVEQGQMVLMPHEPPDVDAIVVVSAGMQWIKTKNGHVEAWATPNRFFGGVALFKAHKAPLLIFTGGKLPWQAGGETEGDVLRRHAEWMQVPNNQILVTGKVENTEQEARAVRGLIPIDKSRIILVTSAFHMARAKKMFENMQFDVTPYPVDLRSASGSLTLESFLPQASALHTTQIALRELLGRLYYEFKR